MHTLSVNFLQPHNRLLKRHHRQTMYGRTVVTIAFASAAKPEQQARRSRAASFLKDMASGLVPSPYRPAPPPYVRHLFRDFTTSMVIAVAPCLARKHRCWFGHACARSEDVAGAERILNRNVENSASASAPDRLLPCVDNFRTEQVSSKC